MQNSDATEQKLDWSNFQKLRGRKQNVWTGHTVERNRRNIANEKKNLPTPPTQNIASNTVPNASAAADGYKTKSALSKALSKVRRALPATTTKKKELVSKLLHTFSADEQAEIINGMPAETKPSKGVSLATIEMVRALYERDNISRMSPNVKDCRVFVNPSNGCKEVKQIRYLQHKLEDVYNMFVEHIQSGQFFKPHPIYFKRFNQFRGFYLQATAR